MSKYIKPAISLVTSGTSTAAASTCSSSTVDANEVMEIIKIMGYDPQKAFGMMETCEQQVVTYEDYCKFSSSIQIFFS